MKNQMKNKKSNKNGFYTPSGISILIVSLILVVALALYGMYELGVLDIPQIFSSIFQNTADTVQNAPVANIANEPQKIEVQAAIPREEYASALKKMNLPNEYYRNYRITVSSYTGEDTTEYRAIKNGSEWWVQTSKNNTIMQTAVCKNNSITVTDNALNASTTVPSSASVSGITSFEQRCGIMSLETLVGIIYSAANGETVEYGGGIADYSLSFTQTRTSGENLFSFSFVCHNGISEEYTFSFENAVILSASKKYNGEEIYKMEIKDYRNSLDEIDIESLFSVK